MTNVGTLASEPLANSPVDESKPLSFEGRTFVWLLSPPWDNVWTRQNHFAIRLARRGAKVLYVENPSAWRSTLKQQGLRALPLAGRPRIREVSPGITAMQPGLSLPGSKGSDSIASLNGRLAAASIRHWLRQNRASSYACWCRVPHCVFPLEHLRPDQIIYDITDDYELYEAKPRHRAQVRQRELRLLHRADHVFITSEELRAKTNLADVPHEWIANGVDYELFAGARRPGPVHALVASIKKPVIAYVGLTSHWMDFDLLSRLGRRWPGQVLMIGPVAAAVENRARSIPGLVWGGLVPQRQLPEYLRGVDVCIMPHIVNELRKRANPLKIWEYLATGIPFVSVDLPALEPVREWVDVAANHAEFERAVEARVADPRPETLRAGQEFARSRSWDVLFAKVERKLLSHTPTI